MTSEVNVHYNCKSELNKKSILILKEYKWFRLLCIDYNDIASMLRSSLFQVQVKVHLWILVLNPNSFCVPLIILSKGLPFIQGMQNIRCARSFTFYRFSHWMRHSTLGQHRQLEMQLYFIGLPLVHVDQSLIVILISPLIIAKCWSFLMLVVYLPLFSLF